MIEIECLITTKFIGYILFVLNARKEWFTLWSGLPKNHCRQSPSREDSASWVYEGVIYSPGSLTWTVEMGQVFSSWSLALCFPWVTQHMGVFSLFFWSVHGTYMLNPGFCISFWGLGAWNTNAATLTYGQLISGLALNFIWKRFR